MEEIEREQCDQQVTQPIDEEAPQTALSVKDGMFSRWLLATLEMLACGVLMLFGTVEIYHEHFGLQYDESGMLVLSESEPIWVDIQTVLADSAWSTTYTMILVGYFCVVAAMAVPLFVKRFRLIPVISAALGVTLSFTGVNAAILWTSIDSIAQKTYNGIPYEASLTEIGMIYFIVSAFAVLELALAIVALHKKKRQASVSVDEEMKLNAGS